MAAKDAATITCIECRDGKFNIKWVVVYDGLVYPMGLNYHRDDDGTIRCGSCRAVLREAERQA